jgi:YHS domain-containing protein
MAKDPKCDMDVDEATAKHTTEFQSRRYYFCAPGSKKAFEAEPQTFLDPAYKPSM